MIAVGVDGARAAIQRHQTQPAPDEPVRLLVGDDPHASLDGLRLVAGTEVHDLVPGLRERHRLLLEDAFVASGVDGGQEADRIKLGDFVSPGGV